VSNYLPRQVTTLRRDEGGQIIILMVLVLPVIFIIIFGVVVNTGVWYLDHRIAQNQVDAAALAAVQALPAENTGDGSPATKRVRKWLEKNGSGPGDLSSCPESFPPPLVVRPGVEYSDRFPIGEPDGLFDTVRVCVRRKSPAVLNVGIPFVYVSASATAASRPRCAAFDIVLVMDNSGSIDFDEHQVLLAAGTALVDEICFDPIDPLSPRLGVSRFNTYSFPVHDMSIDPTSLKAGINSVENCVYNAAVDPTQCRTDIVAGLEGAAAQLSTGLGDRPEAPNKIIFITDGNDTALNCEEEEEEEPDFEDCVSNSDAAIALASLATGAEVFAVGVGNGVSQSTLDAIATEPNARYRFSVGNFDALIDLLPEVVSAAMLGEALIE